ncbi:MAG: alpha-galactosidase [Bacteroidota bacterium]|jgi:alpha-galactosidase|nr:alpha-galactosidase [Bacteroidota bacterium]NLT00179.1 alpha-galactosidase [Bacteroidales bacterium]OQB79514.1 MAG: Alpha-galactosidase [Bacteroidetes bacterium ADurb.Bin123]HOY93701.1 alpha-galactosidase [Prolixibacteraceae bacterium]HPI34077.1 alpha-galactosidase [Prolixibacteraceae bacterium]
MKSFFSSFLVLLTVSFACAGEIIRIDTKDNSLVFKVQDQKLYQLWFGAKTGDKLAALPQGTAFPAYATFGTGEVNEVALRVTHADGNTSTELLFESVIKEESGPGIVQTRISLKDSFYPLRVDLVFKAYFAENIIEQWAEISHSEDGRVTLYNFASAQLSFKATSYWLTQLHGDWGNEMNLKESRLTEGIKIIDSKLGARATMYATPSFLLSLDAPGAETQGETIGASLAWPGSFQVALEVNRMQELRLLAGINPFASQYVLDKNELFKTPALLYTYTNGGRGQVSRNFHRWARKYGIRDGEKSRMTLLNNWEATYFDFNEEKLARIIRDAASLDLELFLLDDGWFGNKYPRNNDQAGLGDWQVNKKKLPNGIGFLVKESQKNNVRFGIWIEPEMVNPQSELYENHPEWVIAQPHRPPILFRNQLILDLANPEVQQFVFNAVDDLLRANPGIAYVKWDCNRFIQNGGSNYLPADKQSNLQIGYARGLLSVYEKVNKAHPGVQLMLCSGGGGRMEYGSLPYFHEYWPSDNTDAIQRIFIQWGGSMFFPAIASCNHVSTVPNHQTRRVTPLKLRFDVAMMGKMGMDLQPGQMSAEEFAFSKSAIATYKEIREVIFRGDLYRLESPCESNRASLMYVTEDKTRAIFFGFLLHRKVGEFLPGVKLQGLDPEKSYLVKEINMGPGKNSYLSTHGKVVNGSLMMTSGISLPLNNEYDSIVIELTAH